MRAWVAVEVCVAHVHTKRAGELHAHTFLPSLSFLEGRVLGLLENLKQSWKIVVEHEVVGVANPGEGHEQDTWLANRCTELHDHFGEGHALCLPGCESPTQDEWKLRARDTAVLCIRDRAWEEWDPGASCGIVKEGGACVRRDVEENIGGETERWRVMVRVVAWRVNRMLHRHLRAVHQTHSRVDIRGENATGFIAELEMSL